MPHSIEDVPLCFLAHLPCHLASNPQLGGHSAFNNVPRTITDIHIRSRHLPHSQYPAIPDIETTGMGPLLPDAGSSPPGTATSLSSIGVVDANRLEGQLAELELDIE